MRSVFTFEENGNINQSSSDRVGLFTGEIRVILDDFVGNLCWEGSRSDS